jgi:hypothetical protein
VTQEPPRYDLIGDFGEWLYRIGRITEVQYRKAAEEWERLFKEQRPVFMIEILLSQGSVTEDSLRDALRSVRLLESLPQDLRHLGTAGSPLDALLGIILRTSASTAASDLEFKLTDRTLDARYQIDGIWYDMTFFPIHIGEPLLDRLRELTATGRLLVRVDGKPMDFVVDSDRPTFRLRIEPGVS